MYPLYFEGRLLILFLSSIGSMVSQVPGLGMHGQDEGLFFDKTHTEGNGNCE